MPGQSSSIQELAAYLAAVKVKRWRGELQALPFLLSMGRLRLLPPAPVATQAVRVAAEAIPRFHEALTWIEREPVGLTLEKAVEERLRTAAALEAAVRQALAAALSRDEHT